MDRNSKTWVSKGVTIAKQDIVDENITSANLVDFLFTISKDDITYSMIMTMFGEFNGKNLANPYDLLEVPAGKWSYFTDKERTKHKSNKSKFTTTIGIFLYNIFLRDFGFSRLFGGYFQDTITSKVAGDVEKTLSYALLEDKIDVEDLKQWENTIQWLMPFETVLTPSHTEKLLTCTKAINKEKEKLLKKYAKELDAGDAAVAEKIEQELIEFAKEYMGDDPSFDTFKAGTMGSIGNNFKNMFIMRGAVKNPDPNAKQQYNVVTGNYLDGVPANEYTTIAGGAAAGAYSRGKKTEFGGYVEKLFDAAYQHLSIDPPGSDCKTQRYITVDLTNKNIGDYMYSFVIKSNGNLERIDSETKDKYIGKTVKLRFASMCESKTGFCNKCVGDLPYLLDNKEIGLIMSQIPDRLKVASLKGFHDSTVTTTTFDPMRAFFQK